MTHCLGRAVFALACALTLAASARAGTIGTGIHEGLCLDPSEALGGMADPNTSFTYTADEPTCQKLCKTAGKDCAQYVKLARACSVKNVSDIAKVEFVNCALTFPDNKIERKLCTDGFAETRNSTIEDIDLDASVSLVACQTWVTTCQAACLIH
jgi:hypothetical protein